MFKVEMPFVNLLYTMSFGTHPIMHFVTKFVYFKASNWNVYALLEYLLFKTIQSSKAIFLSNKVNLDMKQGISLTFLTTHCKCTFNFGEVEFDKF